MSLSVFPLAFDALVSRALAQGERHQVAGGVQPHPVPAATGHDHGGARPQPYRLVGLRVHLPVVGVHIGVRLRVERREMPGAGRSSGRPAGSWPRRVWNGSPCGGWPRRSAVRRWRSTTCPRQGGVARPAAGRARGADAAPDRDARRAARADRHRRRRDPPGARRLPLDRGGADRGRSDVRRGAVVRRADRRRVRRLRSDARAGRPWIPRDLVLHRRGDRGPYGGGPPARGRRPPHPPGAGLHRPRPGRTAPPRRTRRRLVPVDRRGYLSRRPAGPGGGVSPRAAETPEDVPQPRFGGSATRAPTERQVRRTSPDTPRHQASAGSFPAGSKGSPGRGRATA